MGCVCIYARTRVLHVSLRVACVHACAGSPWKGLEKESFPGWVGSLTLFAARGCLVLQTSPELWPFGELG